MCKKIIEWTTHNSSALQNLGLALLRISLGIMFLIFGYKKLISGSDNLTQIGSAISYFGITRGYLLWGYAAALTELCGGISYILGLYTRLMSLPIISLLIVALKFHLQKDDAFTTWAFPAICLSIAVSFLIAGSGIYSADHLIHKGSHHDV